MSSGKNLKYQLRLTKKKQTTGFDRIWTKNTKWFSGKLNNKVAPSEPYIFNGTDRWRNWPVVWDFKSSEAREVVMFQESLINLSGVPEKLKSNRCSAFTSKDCEKFNKNKNIKIEYSPLRLHTESGAA